MKGNTLVCMLILLLAISLLAGVGLHLYFTDPIPNVAHYEVVK